MSQSRMNVLEKGNDIMSWQGKLPLFIISENIVKR